MSDELTQPPPPAPAADDKIRAQLAWATIAEEAVIILAILYGLFHYAAAMPQDVLTIVATLCGTIIGYKVKDSGTIIGYMFGSSSGSTAKQALLDKTKG